MRNVSVVMLSAAFPLGARAAVPTPGFAPSLPGCATANTGRVAGDKRVIARDSRFRRSSIGQATTVLATGSAPVVSTSIPLATDVPIESAGDSAAAARAAAVEGKKELNLTQTGRRRRLVDSKQLCPQEVRRRWPDTDFNVPVDTQGAIKTFLAQPTPRLIVAGILAVVTIRASCGAPIGPADAAAIPLVAVGWAFQEWAIHKYLLHGLENWLGHDVHEKHHDMPFYHVCVDPPEIVAGWTIVAACIFRLLLPAPLALTVLAVYMSMGLVYEWVHYIVHTRVVPQSHFGKELKRHHTLHHLKDETCWLAFTVPQIDTLLGTVPAAKRLGTPRERREANSSGAFKNEDRSLSECTSSTLTRQ